MTAAEPSAVSTVRARVSDAEWQQRVDLAACYRLVALYVKLPNADSVEIDSRKVREYLLSATHPVGRHKARVFAALGVDAGNGNGDAFVAEIRRIAAAHEVVTVRDTEFGRKYTVRGELEGTGGIAAVETVWIQPPGQSFVRLVTVLPRSS